MRWMAMFVVVLAGCGNVSSTGPGGNSNDVPTGPAQASSGSASACTHATGSGVDATVTPGTGGHPGEGAVMGVPPSGSDPSRPPCFDFTAQDLTPPGMILTATSFTLKDGVVQAPSDSRIRIVDQWFTWDEPTAGTCFAQVNVIVEVTEGGATCASEIIFGIDTAAPIYTYAVGS